MTSKEISQRLLDAGYSVETPHNWVQLNCLDGNGDWTTDWIIVTDAELHMIGEDNMQGDKYPAYSAETLFEWLRENENLYLSDSDSNFGFRIVGFKPTSSIYKTNLADMFGEAVIWIESNTQADREANGIKEQS